MDTLDAIAELAGLDEIRKISRKYISGHIWTPGSCQAKFARGALNTALSNTLFITVIGLT